MSAGIIFDGKSNRNFIYENEIIDNNVGLKLNGNKNIIKNNNFIGNEIHATFITTRRNIWNSNYWDNLRGFGPYIIFGFLFSDKIRWFNIDWCPALKPYDI
jgi:nitrous oxidase accessory protein NosD